MVKNLLFILLVFYLIPNNQTICFSQNVDTFGIINSYSKILNIDRCLGQIDLENINGFSVGDSVIIIQMKGALIDNSNSPNFGHISTYNNCGVYEIGEVNRIKNNSVYVKNRIRNIYDTKYGAVQLVKIVHYKNLSVTRGDILAKKWDGKVGGIIALTVDDTLWLNGGSINSTGAGFRGGKVDITEIDTSYFENLFYYNNNKHTARKGEGVTLENQIAGFEYGRSGIANGGGGGFSNFTGGGGGGNLGGGAYGKGLILEKIQYTINDPNSDKHRDTIDLRMRDTLYYIKTNIGGNGSWDLSVNTYQLFPDLIVERLFIGGGGGAGYGLIGNASDGAKGGGIIILNARYIKTTAGKNKYGVFANGDSAKTAYFGGGGGGGGAGTIVLNTKSFDKNLAIESGGGRGGNTFPKIDTITKLNYYEGGNGGYSPVYLTVVINSNIITVYWESVYLITNNPNFHSFPPKVELTSTLICPNDSAIFKLSNLNIDDYFSGDITNKDTLIVMKNSRNLNFEVTNSLGCSQKYSYSIKAVDTAKPLVRILEKSSFCSPSNFETVEVYSDKDTLPPFSSSLYSIKWSNGDTNLTTKYTESGDYWVKVMGKNGNDVCLGTSTFTIHFSKEPVILDYSFDKKQFDSIPLGFQKNGSISITNPSNDSVFIKELVLVKNTCFSIPQSQFPFILLPNETKNIELSFAPVKEGLFSDSIIFNGICLNNSSLIAGKGINIDIDSKTSCNLNTSLKLNKYSLNYVSIAPNPIINSLKVSIDKALDENIEILLFDIFGNLVISSQIIKGEKSIDLNLTKPSSGAYNLLIKSTESGEIIYQRNIVKY